jgi:hypothetical protein
MSNNRNAQLARKRAKRSARLHRQDARRRSRDRESSRTAAAAAAALADLTVPTAIAARYRDPRFAVRGAGDCTVWSSPANADGTPAGPWSFACAAACVHKATEVTLDLAGAMSGRNVVYCATADEPGVDPANHDERFIEATVTARGLTRIEWAAHPAVVETLHELGAVPAEKLAESLLQAGHVREAARLGVGTWGDGSNADSGNSGGDDAEDLGDVCCDHHAA